MNCLQIENIITTHDHIVWRCQYNSSTSIFHLQYKMNILGALSGNYQSEILAHINDMYMNSLTHLTRVSFNTE